LPYRLGVTISEFSRVFELNAPSSSAVGDDAVARGRKRVGARSDHNVPFYKLFACADGADAALGSLGAAANGAALPLMTVHRVSTVSLQFAYLAVASAVPSNTINKIPLYSYTTP
jgi:ATP-binding cassette, subfamily B (MDR/TAP), member 1